MDYGSIDRDLVVQDVLDTGARDAAERALLAGIHEEQFRRLKEHKHPSVRQVARTQHPQHEKAAARAARAAERKRAKASVTDADLAEQHRSVLSRHIVEKEKEHLQNVMAAEDIAEAISNDEVDPDDVVQQTQMGGVTAGTLRQVHENNAAICEAFVEVARERLAELPDPADADDDSAAAKPPAKKAAAGRRR